MTTSAANKMDQLEFAGSVVNGIGRHSELVIPGRLKIPGCPNDWPEELFPGSLNVLVTRYPDEFVSRGFPPVVTTLDVAGFEPQFSIARHLMHNNTLVATPAMPRRGDAQVWMASLVASEQEVRCWVLRRIGSALREQIELVSNVKLRDNLNLSRERRWPVVVKMFGYWRTSEK